MFGVSNVPNIWHLAHLRELMRMLSYMTLFLFLEVMIYGTMSLKKKKRLIQENGQTKSEWRETKDTNNFFWFFTKDTNN